MPVSLRESLAIGFSPRLLWIFSRNEASTNKMGEKSITRKRCANSCWICWLFCQLSALATSKRELSALVDPKTSKGPTSSLGGCLSQRMFQSHPHGWASRFALTLYITIYKLYIYIILLMYIIWSFIYVVLVDEYLWNPRRSDPNCRSKASHWKFDWKKLQLYLVQEVVAWADQDLLSSQ